MLQAVAARLLAKDDLLGFPLRESALRPRPLAPGAEGFGDVIAALQAAGALSPLSPVPITTGRSAEARVKLPLHWE